MWAQPSISCDRNTPFQRPLGPAFWVTSGATSEGRWHVFPTCVGVKLPPCPPGDEWCLLGSKTMRLSWLGSPLFMALPPALCQVLVQDRAGTNMVHEEKHFCSQDLAHHHTTERARAPSFSVPIWSLSSIMHPGQTGHIWVTLVSRERMRPAGPGKVMRTRRKEVPGERKGG